MLRLRPLRFAEPPSSALLLVLLSSKRYGEALSLPNGHNMDTTSTCTIHPAAADRRPPQAKKHTGKPLTELDTTTLPLERPESSEAPPLPIIFISGRAFAIGQQREVKALTLTHPTGQAIFLILWRLLITKYLRHSSEHSLTSTSESGCAQDRHKQIIIRAFLWLREGRRVILLLQEEDKGTDLASFPDYNYLSENLR
eukprot:scaffold10678_cov103-Skeletonema_dohrnii-CCMP3373.AAC.1